MSPWRWCALSIRLLLSLNGITMCIWWFLFFVCVFFVIPLFSFLIYMYTHIELNPSFIRSPLFCHCAASWSCVLETWWNTGLALMTGSSFLLYLYTNQRKYRHLSNTYFPILEKRSWCSLAGICQTNRYANMTLQCVWRRYCYFYISSNNSAWPVFWDAAKLDLCTCFSSNRATVMCPGSCMQFSASCCLLAMSTTQSWCCWSGCPVVKCVTAFGNN